MTTRVASPVFVGRRQQLAELDAALQQARDGRGGTVVVGGDAGIGKTRLAQELVARAEAAGARALVGGCLELGADGLAFTPFTAVLRALVRELGPQGLTELVPGGAELARLLPELGSPPGDPDDGTARGRLFEAVLTLLHRLGDRQPVVFVVEDLHWADRSSRELFAFLVRNSTTSRVLLVATYRSDDLHRRHPLRPLLAELDRYQGVRRLELPELTRQEVLEQATSVLGAEPDPSLINTVYSRSEGNPLFVETLLACPADATCGIDESLRDLLLRIVEQLPEESRQLLLVAAAGGERVGHRLLAAASGRGEVDLGRAVRPAVEANVLTADGDGYAFRHALIREAVQDELLPGEQARLHRAYAEALEADPTLAPVGRYAVEVAHHWYAAHRHDRALEAAWAAAEAVQAHHGYAEQLVMLGRVLELWEAVPDAAQRIGGDRISVLERAVTAAHQSGDFDRGLTFATAALAELDQDREPLRAALLLHHRGKLTVNLGRRGGMADLRAAARLTEADPDSPVRARVLAPLTQALALADEDPTELVLEALAVARRTGDRHSEGQALTTLACLGLERGQVDAAFALYARARRIGVELGSADLLARVATNESDALDEIGDCERAIEVARRGRQDAQRAGTARTDGAFLALNVVGPLVALGRWDEAMTLVERTLQFDPPPAFQSYLRLWRAEVALPRGDLAGAADLLARVRATAGDHNEVSQLWLPLVRLEIELAVAHGDLPAALSTLRAALDRLAETRFARYAWPLLSVGARVLADAAGGADGGDGRRAGEVRTLLEQRAAGLRAYGRVMPAHRATFLAELSRADGRADLGAWQAATAAWEQASHPYPLGYAAYRAGEAAVERGDRAEATRQLRRAVTVTAALGVGPLQARIADLARRARIALVDSPAPAPRAPETHGLTARELDVLRLVAAGRSNGQIAEELFISPKTASVHVSNILAKLGVQNRGEAAALAHQHALV